MSELTPIEGDPVSSTRRALHGIAELLIAGPQVTPKAVGCTSEPTIRGRPAGAKGCARVRRPGAHGESSRSKAALSPRFSAVRTARRPISLCVSV
jgi:hypothetical protein